jgi:diaminopimelate decarboxylase
MIKTFQKFIGKQMIARSSLSQARGKIRDLSQWDLQCNNKDEITVDGLSFVDLVKKYGTPLLVVNEKRLWKDSMEIKNALFPAPNGSMVLYSYKTNCTPGIIREIHKLDIGAEVISPYELWLAEQMGVPGSMIVYNGVNKTVESIERAAQLGILSINLDSAEEIDRVYKVAKRQKKILNVGIRLGFNRKAQFGFEPDRELLGVVKEIKSRNDGLKLNCIHFNVTSNARGSSTHCTMVERTLKYIAEIRNESGVEIPYLDIGGGFGVPTSKNMNGIEYGLYRLFGCYPSPPSIDDYQAIGPFISDILETIKKSCSELRLRMPMILLEPGRFIVSRCQVLLSTVNSLKENFNGLNYAITDAGRLSVTFPCDFEYHEVFVANKTNAEPDSLYHVMGRICTSADWMFKNRSLPRLNVGDILAVMDAGAYFSSYSTNFSFPRPAIVSVKEGTDNLIRREDSFDHMIAMDSFA